MFDSEVELKIALMEKKLSEESANDTLLTLSPDKRRLLEDKIYTLEHELEDLKWKVTGNEIQKLELLNAKETASREATTLRQKRLCLE